MGTRRSARGNGRAQSMDVKVKRLKAKIKKANRQATKEIEKNVRKFGIIANAAERDLKKLKGAGKGALRTLRGELKRSWKDLKCVVHQQY